MESYRKWKKRVVGMAMAEGQTATTSQGEVYYTDTGEGFPVMHSHGSPTSADSGPRAFYKVAQKAGVRLITPARPGFLGTKLSVGASIEQQADMFVVLMDTLKIEQTMLFSWSSGGPSAIAAAAKYPDRFKGLILYSSLAHKWEYKMSTMDKMMMKDLAIWLIDQSRKRNPDKFRQKVCQGTGWDFDYLKKSPESIQMLDTFFEFMIPASIRNAGSYNDVKNLTQLTDPGLEKVKIPTLVIFSPNNKKLPFSNGETAAAKIPGARLVTYEHGAHFFLVDPRSAFIFDEIKNFVQTILK